MIRCIAAVCLVALAVAGSLVAPASGAGSERRSGIRLEVVGPSTVALGSAVHLRALFDGDRLDGKVKASLSIEPEDGSQLPIPVKLVEEVIFPGDVLERSWRVDTGRFIAEPGRWVLRLGDAAPVTIGVTRAAPAMPRFADITRRSGLAGGDWDAANPVTCAPSGLGAAWGDIDADDDLDLYVTRYRGGGVLYRAQDGRFEEVTTDAGITPSSFPETMATFVDIDSDGDQDLHVVGSGGGALWRNEGEGRFVDHSKRTGLDLETAGSASSWADVDRDGDLDVIVAAYGMCETTEDELLDDGPRRDTLLLQAKDGSFDDRTSLLGTPPGDDGLGFGALWVDVDSDSDLDLLVVNDDLRFVQQRGRHRLWINRLDEGRGLRFDEEGRSRGAGERRNAMGIAPIDHDRDGDIDLGVSDMGPSQLLRNDGTGRFEDVGVEVGADRGFQDGRTPSTTWGLVAVDIDNDGDEDLAVPAGALGTTDDYFGGAQPARSFGRMNLAAPNSSSLLLSEEGARYVDVGAAAGLQRYGLWRGVSIADTDDDGRVDLLFTRLAGAPMYLRNETRQVGHWLGLRLRGTAVRDACGAVVHAAGRAFLRACGGVGLGSGHDPRVHVGLGDDTGEQRVEVSWPDGSRERFQVEGVDRTVELVQGTGDTKVTAPDLPSEADIGDEDDPPWAWALLLAPLVAIVLLVRRRRARSDRTST